MLTRTCSWDKSKKWISTGKSKNKTQISYKKMVLKKDK